MKLLVVLVALYVAFDLADPTLPGALNFNPDESVDAVQLTRESIVSAPSLAAAPAAVGHEALILARGSLVARPAPRARAQTGCFLPPCRIPPPPDDLPF